MTTTYSDPNIPAGWLDSQGSDRGIPEAVKHYTAGINSGGYPKYTSDATQRSDYPNGVLS